MKKGLIYAVGIGPGGAEYITGQALSAMADAEVICGYTVYVDLVRPLFEEGGALFGSGPKEFFATGMRGEVERCRKAVEIAAGGKKVAMVCSGDSGVYGMAGLIMELAEGAGPSADSVATDEGLAVTDIEVTVVPGITAALSGSAVLGAPLGHDFSVISLSNLLTPQGLIDKRLKAAAESDMIICLYNPKSHGRPEVLNHACEILLSAKSPDTACGWVRNIGREGESYGVCKLSELSEAPVDMFTTVFIGSSTTRISGGKLITPRGYKK